MLTDGIQAFSRRTGYREVIDDILLMATGAVFYWVKNLQVALKYFQ
jgi:hypothetical protein